MILFDFNRVHKSFIFLIIFSIYFFKRSNKFINENFFIIDSNNLKTVNSHIYGYIISKQGILTDNYFKMKGHYEEPEPFGVYTMIRKNGNNIIINQDCHGGYGVYLFENKNEKYFALSNSFLLLVEYLVRKQKLTLNKDFSDNFLVTELTTFSVSETMIKEIIQLPPNSLLNININDKIINISYIDYKERSIPLESKEGLKIIDKWFDKWGYIIRSLKRKTDNISFDLSGGFDSRLVFSILLNSGINMNEILINSRIGHSHKYDEDFKIASNISSQLGFKLNNFIINQNNIVWSRKDSLSSIIYTKLGFTKNIDTIRNRFYLKPRFFFLGGGGENLRGIPGYTIHELMERKASKGRQIKGHEEEFYKASMRLYNRSVELLKKENSNYDDYEIAAKMYFNSNVRYHFGKGALLGFINNNYPISPLMDPELKQIKYEISEKSKQDLIAYIFTRFAPKLILFPFDKNRVLDLKSLQKANKLNKQISKYSTKTDFNKHFFIDVNRKSPFSESHNNKNDDNYIGKCLKSRKFSKIINKVYDKGIYNWVFDFSKNTTHIPLRHQFALFSIVKIIEGISFQRNLIKTKSNNISFYI